MYGVRNIIIMQQNTYYIQQPFMKKPLAAREEPKEIALTYISDDKKVLLVVPEKMLVIMTGVVLGGIALQKAIGKQFFSQKVEIDCPKTTGIKLKDLNTGVNRNKRLGQELTAIDSIVPTEVVNAKCTFSKIN
jgi:hypothetical protein